VQHINKMQSKKADFAAGAARCAGERDQTTLSDVQLVPAPGELDENLRIIFDFGQYSLHYVRT